MSGDPLGASAGWDDHAVDVLAPALARVVDALRPRPDEPPDAIEAPERLRPLLRFARLPATARRQVLAALDDDPDLCVAVRARLVHPTALDVLLLDRPEGWHRVVDELGQRRAAGDRARADDAERRALERRSDAATAARAQAEERLAQADARSAALRDELAAARREVADTARSLDAAVAEAATAGRQAETAGREARAARVETGHAADELARARAAIADLSERLRAQPPAPPTVDRDLVLAAIEALRERAAGLTVDVEVLADQLGPVLDDPAPPASRPPRAERRAPIAPPGGLHEDDPQTAESLLWVPRVRWLVDAYNVSITAWPDLPIADQRQALVRLVGGLSATTGASFELVFDGEGPTGTRRVEAGIEVVFTADGVEADDHVIEAVRDTPVDRSVVVVSDDRRVRDGARSLGANLVRVSTFVDLLTTSR